MTNVSSVFDQLVDKLEELGKSTRAYKSCAVLALSLAKENQELAAPLLLLALRAQRFVDSYDGEPVSSPDVDAAFEAFSANTAALKSAFCDGTSDQRVNALNRAAVNLT